VVALVGAAATVPLGRDVTVYAPGIVGDITLLPPGLLGKRAGEEPAATVALAGALAKADLRTAYSLQISAAPAAAAPASPVRGADNQPKLVVDVPQLGEDRIQIAMLVDPDGGVSWHFGRSAPASSVRFLIPADKITVPPQAGTKRGLVAYLGKKLLEILVFPVLEKGIGIAAKFLAQRWEEKNRPTVLRSFLSKDYATPGVSALDGDGWDLLRGGPALMFVHGTFSSSVGGFAALPPAVLDELAAIYGNRVFAVDHPTLSADPDENLTALLKLVPPGLSLPVDLIAHSRGGLLSRALAAAAAADRHFPLRVRRIVYVGTPNLGTPLADPAALGHFLDRLSTMLNVVPDGPWSVVTDVLDGVLTTVKVVAQGGLGALPGIASMDPQGTWLDELEKRSLGAVETFGISAEYEPDARPFGLRAGADALVDRVFGREANDCVVPSVGVFGGNSASAVGEKNRMSFAADRQVWHCSYFGRAETAAALSEWLRRPVEETRISINASSEKPVAAPLISPAAPDD
jgi:hypothetical protein